MGEKINSHLKDKNFKIKLTKYENSQYATVKQFVKEYKEEENWTRELIEKRTIEMAKILHKKRKAAGWSGFTLFPCFGIV